MGLDILDIGKSGLFSSKKALQTVGHNIANVNTEGFSRQRTLQQSANPISEGGLNFGTGSLVKGVERVHTQYIEKQLQSAISNHNYHKTRSENLNDLELYFNETTTDGISQAFGSFLNSFRELSSFPESEPLRGQVRETAKIFIRNIQMARQNLNSMITKMNSEVNEAVNIINTNIDQLAQINLKISEMINLGGESGDLEDQRDLIVKKISEFFAVETYKDKSGNFNLNAKGVGTLVSGAHSQKFFTGTNSEEVYFPGKLDVFLESNRNAPLSQKFSQGKFAALFDIQENDIKMIQERIDRLAFNTANAVNAIHRQGYNQNPSQIEKINRQIQNINKSNSETIKPNQDISDNFFWIPDSPLRASEYIDLDNSIKEDLRNIATAKTSNAPGDNSIAIAISKLHYAEIPPGSKRTLIDEYLDGVGLIALNSNKSRISDHQTEGIFVQTKSIRDRISGVSLDEEAANMVRYQQAYEAAGKVMKVADEMFRSILAMKS
jgi:flagellar hook-associated protein 1 FlgK